MNVGDTVVLVDGTKGTVAGLDYHGDGSVYAVDFPRGTYSHDRNRLFNYRNNKHLHHELPDVARIIPQGTETTMSTPYDTEIATAEKALADLKAKAIAEAAKAKTVPELAVGQKWKTRGGRIVTIKKSSSNFSTKELQWWYGNHTVSKSCHSVGFNRDLHLDDLVEMVGHVKLRWYTPDEFVALASLLPPFVVAREIGKTKLHKVIPVGTSDNWYFSVSGTCSDVDSGRFEHAEYSTDAGKTWNKFGVEE